MRPVTHKILISALVLGMAMGLMACGKQAKKGTPITYTDSNGVPELATVPILTTTSVSAGAGGSIPMAFALDNDASAVVVGVSYSNAGLGGATTPLGAPTTQAFSIGGNVSPTLSIGANQLSTATATTYQLMFTVSNSSGSVMTYYAKCNTTVNLCRGASPTTITTDTGVPAPTFTLTL